MPVPCGTKPYMTSSPAVVSTYWASQRPGWPRGKPQQIWPKWPLRVSFYSRNPEHRGEWEEWAYCFICPQIYLDQFAYSTFECISGKLESDQSCLNILNIYRPPGPASTFFNEFQDILPYVAWLPRDLAPMGDFNLHIDSSSSGIRRFTDISESFGLDQYVNFRTHFHGCYVVSLSYWKWETSPGQILYDLRGFLTLYMHR